MSPVWMQYDAASAHRPFSGSQRPEQHSELDVQALFAVVQEVPGIFSHVPLVPQLPEQHALPATGHAAPMVRH